MEIAILKKRKTLSINDKFLIIQDLQNQKSHTQVCNAYQLSSSTVSTIWKNRESIIKSFEECRGSIKKRRTCKNPDIDKALYKWFLQKRNQNVPINGPILQVQADKFAAIIGDTDFSCNHSWISRFIKRHDISFGKICGEANSVDFSKIDTWKTERWDKIKDQYAEDDIFNVDEAGVFYNLMPDKTFRTKGETCAGGKLSKLRVTVLIGANMTGKEKRKLFVIGKSKNPLCFRGVKQLPVKYNANTKSCMTAELFASVLAEWDTELRKKNNRKILLVVDNCAAHNKIPSFPNISLIYFPPNVTSVLQPMDQGVIKCFKGIYRRKLVLEYIDNLNRGITNCNVSLLQAIRFMAEAWNEVTEKTIRNCFIKSGLCRGNLVEKDDDNEMRLSDWLSCNQIHHSIPTEFIDNYDEDDMELPVEASYSDAEILNDVLAQENINDEAEIENEEHTEEIEFASSSEALSALKVLSRFHETNELNNDNFFTYWSKMKTIVTNFHLKKKAPKQIQPTILC
ncbi:tigger transposable element-derived protein 4-like [Trichogramma pretiosum]|uniref:tigger transposable element-derived protein 4-like n=1 Tax=Trichogramma pretiosum TaxID=7493 RepID=UPI000C71C943|nr:tigger transposable element-derived protein 4-like [Trichogramma pretiosum]